MNDPQPRKDPEPSTPDTGSRQHPGETGDMGRTDGPFGPPPGHGSQTFNPQPYGGYPPTAGYAAYTPPVARVPGSIATLLAVSVVLALATGVIGIPSAVVAAFAWRQHTRDAVAAARRTTTGWIVLAVNFAVGAPLLVAFYIWASNSQ